MSSEVFWSSLHSNNEKTIQIRETNDPPPTPSEASSSSDSEPNSGGGGHDSSDDDNEPKGPRSTRGRRSTRKRPSNNNTTNNPSNSSPAFDANEYNDEQLYDHYCDSIRLEHPSSKLKHYGPQKKSRLGSTLPLKKLLAKRMKPPDLHALLLQSKDQLFFLKYQPQGTQRVNWYLVQVDMESTQQINPTFRENGQYYCVFLAKHADDTPRLLDDQCRWWPEWYKYKRVKENGEDVIVYGDRVLIQPHLT